jgi:hypothetical protein
MTSVNRSRRPVSAETVPGMVLFESALARGFLSGAGTISLMAAQEPNNGTDLKPGEDAGFLTSHQNREPTSWLPWIIAAAAVILGLGILVVVGGRTSPESSSTGTGMAPADPYASKLSISGIQMSEATSFSGAKVTYIDGQIANTGDRTLTGITVQVGFHNDVGQFAQRLSLPLNFIRTRQPYVDTQPVSAAPIEPGQSRDFRLIFDTVPADWNMQVPEIRVISVRSR